MSSSRPPKNVAITATGVAIAFVLPGLYVIGQTVSLSGDLGEAWSDSLGPLWRTLQLATAVSITATLLGTSLAWLLHRTDLPGRRIWRVLVPLPLALPSFIGAAAFIAAVTPQGVLGGVAEAFGLGGPQGFRGLGAAWLVLSLFTYPYVYLPVAARLANLSTSVEESALLLGASEAA
ncbi:MAG TPA: hypothetical protein VMW08_00005, partial [Acidimicrobiales bacterium]|nr:hypothetical protein [Acidimicrobiales bacterium]